MMSNQIITGMMLSGIEEDVLKLPDEPPMVQKWILIQRLFIIMIRIYEMGKKRDKYEKEYE